MFRFIVKRVLLSLLTLWAISSVTFLVFFAVPASPADTMCSKNCDPRTLAAITKSLGIDKPLTQQYIDYHAGLFKGRTFERPGFAPQVCPAPCLAYSFRTNEPVTKILARAMPVTFSIVVGAAVIWLAAGVTLGMISALRRGTVFDKSSIAFSLIGASMPVYVFAILLLVLFVFGLHLLPFPQYVSIFDNPGKWFLGLILPWLALAFIFAAQYARLARSQMLETLSEDYIRTARAIGLPKRTVYLRHAFRAAVTPIVTVAGLDIGVALGGAVITETIFGLQGMGWYAVQAIPNLNLPVIMATVLVAAFFIVCANVIVDCLYAVIDPRVRLS
jgi:peptide/nickel transport system permease protein